MNRVGTGIAALFCVVGALMVLIGRELEDRGGELGDTAKVFVMIGMIWTAVAILLFVLLLIVGSSSVRAQRRAELKRDASQGPDVPTI
jgi:hypothetical protein